MENGKSTLTRDEYFKIKGEAIEDFNNITSDQNNTIKLDTKDKMLNYAKSNAHKKFGPLNDDAFYIYVSNFLIGNNELFKSAYLNMNKNLKEVAKYFNVDPSIVVIKVTEIAKYERMYGKIMDSEKNNDNKLENTDHITKGK